LQPGLIDLVSLGCHGIADDIAGIGNAEGPDLNRQIVKLRIVEVLVIDGAGPLQTPPVLIFNFPVRFLDRDVLQTADHPDTLL